MNKKVFFIAGRTYWFALTFGAVASSIGLAATTGKHFLATTAAESSAAVKAFWVPAASPTSPLAVGDNDNDLVLDAPDLDDDNDGIPDTVEGTTDSDGDGLRNSFDLDSDDDGIPDAVEANHGVLPAGMDGSGRYPLLYVVANDLSPKNGLVDAVAATPLADADQDGDGFKNRLDRDSDDDGLTDAREANGGSLRPNIDANGQYTTTTDVNANGLNDNADPTAILVGTALAIPNTDAAGRPDFLDLDSDDDGATGWYEAQSLVMRNGNTNTIAGTGNALTALVWIRDLAATDADNDGLLDGADPDRAGITALVPVNTDGADVPDYLDADSDGDGVPDRTEFLDDNHDGSPDFAYAATDTDNDGIVDAYDSENNTSGTTDSGYQNLVGANNAAGGGTDYGMKSLRPNADYDYLLDWRDADDDNDGLLTSAEAVGGNYLVYNQGGYYTQRSYTATPIIVREPDYLHMQRSNGLKADKRTAVLDWNDGTFTDGAPGGAQPNAYLDNKAPKRAGVTVSIAQFRTTANGTIPATTTITQTGTAPQTGGTQSFGTNYPKNPILETDKFLLYGNKLSQGFFQTLATNGTAGGQSIGSYKFSQPLRGVTVGLVDVDFGAGAGAAPASYEDDVEVVGYRGGTPVTLATTDVLFNAPVHNAGTATVAGGQRVVADNTVPTVPTKLQAGNVWFSFSVPIDELRVYYRNAGGRTGVQIVSLTDFRWVNTDFDGDNVADGTQSTVADDLDSDNDGIPDLKEVGNVNIFADADNDGIPNYLDSNTTGWLDVNADGVDDRYDADLDGQVNPLDRDSDNDGITDTREAGGADATGDGIIDGFLDTNTDGLNDATATTPLAAADFDGDGKPNYLDRDSDNDGITDTRENGGTDATGDGVDDVYAATSPDLNFDGLADAALTSTLPADFDGDGKPNYLDRDSDQDGITDTRETGQPDANNNGIVDGATTDADGDGLYDSVDPAVAGGTAGTVPSLPNSDGTGKPNYLDRDADDDGLVDAIEAGGTDADGNGIADGFVDANGDGLTDSPRTPADTDGDGEANYLDLDSDNDGIWDLLEAQPTAGRRALAGTDTDTDGIDNNFDKDVNAAYAVTAPNNADGTDALDYLDQNSDNDAYSDFSEGFDDDKSGFALNDLLTRTLTFITSGGNALYYLNLIDTDGDGTPNYLEDDDADGIANLLDVGNAYYHDTDGDGLIDLFDPKTSGLPSLLPSRLAGEADFRRAATATPLPVSLTAFDAKATGADAHLSWHTASEKDNDHFTVERSLNGTDFEAIGTVQGQGNTSQSHSYSFADLGVGTKQAGPVYYRLQQVDADGTATSSPVRAVRFAALPASRPTLFPNPATDYATLDLTAWPTGSYPLTVTDMAGRLLVSGTAAGGTKHPLAVQQLSRGVYLVTVVGPAGPVSQRLFKE